MRKLCELLGTLIRNSATYKTISNQALFNTRKAQRLSKAYQVRKILEKKRVEYTMKNCGSAEQLIKDKTILVDDIV